MTDVGGRSRVRQDLPATAVTRLSRVDPYGPLLAFAALLVFLLHGFDGRLKHDMALYAYAGQQLADGVPPYLGVLSRTGPLAHVVPGLGALAAEWFGKDELLGMRALMMVLSAGCVWLAYLLGRDLVGSRAVGLVAGATLLVFPGTVAYAMAGPREKTTMLLFVLAALWALTRRSWLLAGGAVAMAALTWQPAFFPTAVAALVAAALLPQWSATLRALARFAVGGVVVTAVTVAAFAAAGALAAFYEGFAGVALGGYTTQSGLAAAPTRAVTAVLSGYGWTTALFYGGLLASVVLGAARLRGPDRTTAPGATLVALGAGTLVCAAWACFAFQAWGDTVIAVPFAVAGVAGVAQAAANLVPEQVGPRGLLVATLAMVVAAGVGAGTSRPTSLPKQRALAHDMLRAAGPGASVQSFGALGPLVLTGRDNPSRYVNFTGGLHRYLDESVPGGLASLAEDVEQRRPTLLVMSKSTGPKYKWLRPVLREAYRPLGGDPINEYWFVSRAVPGKRVAELEAVLRDGGLPTGGGS